MKNSKSQRVPTLVFPLCFYAVLVFLAGCDMCGNEVVSEVIKYITEP